MMQDFLSKLIGRKLDLYCGAASSLGGELVMVEDGVAHLRDEEGRMCFVAIEKIVCVWDARDAEHRAGFVSPGPNTR